MVRNNIKRRTAIVTMLAIGVLAIIFGIRGFIADFTAVAFGIVGLAVAFALVFEIGLKRLTKLSSLKELGIMQGISLVFAVVLFIVSIGLLFQIEIPILINIAGGSFIAGGILIIIEAFTF